MQKARRHHKWLRPLVSTRFQVLFTSLFEILFTFPSRYQFTIGLSGVFSLGGWSRRIHTGFHVPRTTQDTTILLSFTYTGLSPSMATFSKVFQFIAVQMSWSYNPSIAVTTLVWAVPISLAATIGITFVFSSSGYLDVSVLRVYLLADTISSIQWVAPLGNLRIKGYVPLPEAYRSLSRPSSSLRAQAFPIRS